MPPRRRLLLEQLAQYERAIKRFNNVDAMVDLAYLLLYEPEVPNDVPRAFQLLERAIKQARHPQAMNVLAVYLHNNGSRQQRRRVTPLLEQSVQLQLNHKVLQNLANTLYRGECGLRDVPRAVQLLQRAIALSDDPQCMADLATIILKEKNVVGDKKYALNLYKRAIQLSNDASLMNNLGVIYMDGTAHVSSCDCCAAKWFERAIQTADLPTTKYNYASLLVNSNRIRRDPERAISLLEQAVKDRACEDFIVGLADIYESCEQVLDFQRAVHLYQRAYSEYDSITALNRLIYILAFGRDGVVVDLTTAYQLCKSYYRRTKRHTFLMIQACILWSGTRGVPRNPSRAAKICTRYRDVGCSALALMMRCGAPDVARNLQKCHTLSAHLSHAKRILLNGLLLSECAYDEHKYEQAQQQFLALLDMDDEQLRNDFVWMPLCVRIGNITLPYAGSGEHVANSVKRFEQVHNVSVLNRASIFLEQKKGDEAVRMYESLMETDVRDMAMVNLGYVLREGIGGVEKDRERAKQLFESCVKEYKDLFANALFVDMLVDGNVLSEDANSAGIKVWESMVEHYPDEAELHILDKLLSENGRRIVRSGAPGGDRLDNSVS
eukprot:TRINITY_DN137_c0_g1_i1.p1 TRINITY_DN137_c0_g1~~TRINITY_DN137_c0_g1_i1.p1  ORF type:complete len:608 (+),score=131.68 TRINITY_DN137_c0_g1_i1:231-2054(+)